MPNVGHSQTNSTGPAGGSGHVHHRETKECGPPPPANGNRTGPAGSESRSCPRPPGLPAALPPSENCRPNRKERRAEDGGRLAAVLNAAASIINAVGAAYCGMVLAHAITA